MHPVLKHLVATDFADLSGTKVEGQIALSDELVNLGLMDVLAKLKADDPAANTASAPASAPPKATEAMPDPAILLRKLKIDHLKYRTENGRTVLEIKAGM